MKTAIAGCDGKKLAELNVDGEKILLDLFGTLFAVLYNAPRAEFNWKVFKDKALIKDKCEDFIGKASVLNPSEVPPNLLTDLEQIKANEAL